ncbi:Nramp family divalent metal transporter [Candidatus Woesearchaeota archaeon]|nr:Nramp family divalent metal transporter [Candidatus Woesearchaeota archaeon]
MKLNIRSVMLFLAVIGPGLITANVDNDAGGIATFSVAGARFGYALLWTLIPITILLAMTQEMCARMGAVTGKGLSDLIRENFGIRMTVFIMIGLVLANFSVTVAEFAGIAAAAHIFGVSKYLVIPLVVFITSFFIIRSNYKTLEKIFLIMILFYGTYVVSAFMAKPDWGEVLQATVVPSFTLSAPYLFLLVGLIGTNITPWMQFFLQSTIVEKGIKEEDYKYSRIEVWLGSIMTNAVSFFIIVTCAVTLFAAGVYITDAGDAAAALEPVAGRYASLLFAIGLFGAALFGAMILPLSTAFSVTEGMGWENGLNKNFKGAPEYYTIFLVLLIGSALLVLAPGIPLIKVMLVSQVINGLLLPFILIPMLLLTSNKALMGKHANSKLFNAVAWTGCILVVILALLLTVLTLFPNIGFA